MARPPLAPQQRRIAGSLTQHTLLTHPGSPCLWRSERAVAPRIPAGFSVIQYVDATRSLPTTTPPQPGTLAPWPLSAQVGAARACCVCCCWHTCHGGTRALRVLQARCLQSLPAMLLPPTWSLLDLPPPPRAQAQFVMSAALLEAGAKGDKVPGGYVHATQKARRQGSCMLVLCRAAAVQAAPASTAERRLTCAYLLRRHRSRRQMCPIGSGFPNR